MKTAPLFSFAALPWLVLLGGVAQVHADITLRVSVKFILNSAGTRPSSAGGGGNSDISTSAGFDSEITRGNGILAVTGRGYRLQVTEYIDIQPAAPSGQPADYWFDLAARANRQTIEAEALAHTDVWRWNGGALNIYVNNSSSGQCSFIGTGSSISLGATIVTGTVLHEVGHFFDLRHTHPNDPDCPTFNPTQPLRDYLGNGDGLDATVEDHACFTRDQLSMAKFNTNFVALLPSEQARINTSWLNVMSYHQEDQLLDDQMDIWVKNGNGARLFMCSGRTWFVAPGGSDQASGTEAAASFATMARAVSSVVGASDVILLRSGTFNAPPGNVINTACTLRSTRGSTTILPP